MASSNRNVAEGFAYYALTSSIYKRWIAKVHEVSFHKKAHGLESSCRSADIFIIAILTRVARQMKLRNVHGTIVKVSTNSTNEAKNDAKTADPLCVHSCRK